jgi:hypothetical protein
LRDRRQNPLDLGGENRSDLARLDRLVVASFRHGVANARCGGDAQIGADQHVLEVVERGGVEFALGENIDDALADRR